MTTLQNKVAIVTGASSGIGEATALLFAKQGAATILSGRDQDRLGAVVTAVEKGGGRAIAVAGDVRSANA